MRTPKERVLATIEGREVDRFPVSMTWQFLYMMEHLRELIDVPDWWVHRLNFLENEDHLELYRQMNEKVPLDTLEPFPGAAPRDYRRRQEFVERDGIMHRHDTETDEWFPIRVETESGFPTDNAGSEEQRAFSKEVLGLVGRS